MIDEDDFLTIAFAASLLIVGVVISVIISLIFGSWVPFVIVCLMVGLILMMATWIIGAFLLTNVIVDKIHNFMDKRERKTYTDVR